MWLTQVCDFDLILGQDVMPGPFSCQPRIGMNAKRWSGVRRHSTFDRCVMKTSALLPSGLDPGVMSDQVGENGRLLAGSCNGTQHTSLNMENHFGFRDYLFCVGIYISRNSCWRPRSSTVSFGGNAFLDCRTRSLWLDDGTRRAFPDRAPMGVSIFPRDPDLRPRLWAVVLGRAACAFGHCRGHDGHDPGVYGAVGNHFPANAEAYCPLDLGALDRDRRSRSADEPVVEPRRGADRHGGRRGTDRCID